VTLLKRAVAGEIVTYELGGWPSPYGIEYRVDVLSGFVLAFVSFIGAMVATMSGPSLRHELPLEKHYLYHVLFLLCLAGLLGITVTGDLFNVFVFLEISSLSSYALISLGKSRRALLAAFRYLVMGTIGATFILIGIGLLFQLTGTLNMIDLSERLAMVGTSRTKLVAFAFLSVGLSIKMALFPLHAWLPKAYTFAPSMVSAFIAATSTKVSVYLLIRLTFTIFGKEFAFDSMPLDSGLMVLSLAGIFIASTAAIYQSNIKRLLAFSSIAQIGYMVLGISFVSVAGLTGGIVHMLNHALIKGGMFMAVACLAIRMPSLELDELRGIGRKMPWTCMAWVLGGLGLIGVPFTAGFVSKWQLLTSAFAADQWPVAALLLLSSLLALVYVWRFVEAAFFSEPTFEAMDEVCEAPLMMLVPTYVVIGATIVLGFWTPWSAGIARQAAVALLGEMP
jgi:multicomponent Na+:H+ antiporter subunit D